MKEIWSRYKILAITLFVISAVAMTFIYNLQKAPLSLPIYQPNMLSKSLVDTSVQYVRTFHTIPDFKLVNQNGDTITQTDYKGKIYVADFFFTTCQSICPKLTGSMKRVQDATSDDDEIKLISHSVTPRIDSVAQLKRYAKKHGVIDSKWNLVTGPKKEIYDLARKAYCVAKTKGDGGKYDMIHTENIALIDREKRIRGFYDGTDPKDIDKLLDDIKILEKIEARDNDD